MNRGRPVGTKTKQKEINIDIFEFKKEVMKGQSVGMISFKFKISKQIVLDLCKKENLPCNTTGNLAFISKLYNNDRKSKN
jgi:hypothetical protein